MSLDNTIREIMSQAYYYHSEKTKQEAITAIIRAVKELVPEAHIVTASEKDFNEGFNYCRDSFLNRLGEKE